MQVQLYHWCSHSCWLDAVVGELGVLAPPGRGRRPLHLVLPHPPGVHVGRFILLLLLEPTSAPALLLLSLLQLLVHPNIPELLILYLLINTIVPILLALQALLLLLLLAV